MNFIATYCQSNMHFYAIPLESPSAKSDVFRSELDKDLAVPLVSTAKNQQKNVAILQFHTIFITSHIIFFTVIALKRSNRKEVIITVSQQRALVSLKLLGVATISVKSSMAAKPYLLAPS